jgi:hypothetical protein
MGLLGMARANTSVGESPETFLLLLLLQQNYQNPIWKHNWLASPRLAFGTNPASSTLVAFSICTEDHANVFSSLPVQLNLAAAGGIP